MKLTHVTRPAYRNFHSRMESAKAQLAVSLPELERGVEIVELALILAVIALVTLGPLRGMGDAAAKTIVAVTGYLSEH